jgi:DNA invertase Pin-like site-specific DNA recombinase
MSKITPEHLGRAAVVYVRQSTMAQVMGNLESQRRQYELAAAAKVAGFASVTVIDDDLGRSGSGSVERPGFERLVALVCSGGVGAVYCIEASRLARNGRDWHHLIDLCALTGALVVDPDGVYDPRIVNDRLLLEGAKPVTVRPGPRCGFGKCVNASDCLNTIRKNPAGR